MKIDIGARFRALREQRGLSQEDVSGRMGFADRQIVSNIEAGRRRLSAAELVAAVDIFGVSLEQFTNPFLPTGVARFSWRQNEVATEELRLFEQRAGEWIGAYQAIGLACGVEGRALVPGLGLTDTSLYEHAIAAGQKVAAELDLGDVPSSRLVAAMEERLDVLVLMVDTIPGVSGAACTLPGQRAAIVNRSEPAVRRNFDLAHELFHLLTWDTMPPRWLDGQADGGGHRRVRRVEQLADNFASGLLMPMAALKALGEPAADLGRWINDGASTLGVSSTALKWRLVNAGLGPAELRDLPDEAFRDGRLRRTPPPPAFSRRFVERVAGAVRKGHVSGRRAAELVDLTTDDLGELCDLHGVERPAELTPSPAMAA